MSTTIVTGSNFFRAITTLNAADIQGLDTPTNVLLVPPTPGKSISILAMTAKLTYGTITWVTGSGAAHIYFGNATTHLALTAEVLAALINGSAVSEFLKYAPPFLPSAKLALSAVAGLGIYLIETAAGFNVSGDGSVEIVIDYELV